MSTENVEIVREIYERFNQRDYDAMWELMVEDMEFRFIDWGPNKRTVVGRREPAAQQFWHETFGSFTDSRMEPEVLLDGGERVLAAIHNTGRGKASGACVDMHTFGVWTIRDGLAISFEGFETRAEAINAAGLSA